MIIVRVVGREGLWTKDIRRYDMVGVCMKHELYEVVTNKALRVNLERWRVGEVGRELWRKGWGGSVEGGG